MHHLAFQGPIDYSLYEAYGGGAGKAVSAVLNNPRATQFAIGAVAAVVVSAVKLVMVGGDRHREDEDLPAPRLASRLSFH